jgi:quinol-cytochrome oxidoreductase complex cytochrome b subunit
VAGTSAAPRSRFFSLHVVILPALTGGMILLHLLLVQKFGMSVPPSLEKNRIRFGNHVKFFPNYFLRDVMVWSVALAALFIVAAIYPAELGKKADPFGSAPAGIKPEWYFLAPFYTLKLIPSHVLRLDGELMGIVGFTLLAVWCHAAEASEINGAHWA